MSKYIWLGAFKWATIHHHSSKGSKTVTCKSWKSEKNLRLDPGPHSNGPSSGILFHHCTFFTLFDKIWEKTYKYPPPIWKLLFYQSWKKIRNYFLIFYSFSYAIWIVLALEAISLGIWWSYLWCQNADYRNGHLLLYTYHCSIYSWKVCK